MGTMLMTRSTPRITYKIGMRVGLGAEEDCSPPRFGWEAPSIEVAADFTGIYRILMWKECWAEKTVSFAITKVPADTHVWSGFGTKTHQLLRPGAEALHFGCFALAAARHQLRNRRKGSLALVKDGEHLFGDRHLDPSSPRQS